MKSHCRTTVVVSNISDAISPPEDTLKLLTAERGGMAPSKEQDVRVHCFQREPEGIRLLLACLELKLT